jgi:hypothetical protein
LIPHFVAVGENKKNKTIKQENEKQKNKTNKHLFVTFLLLQSI